MTADPFWLAVKLDLEGLRGKMRRALEVARGCRQTTIDVAREYGDLVRRVRDTCDATPPADRDSRQVLTTIGTLSREFDAWRAQVLAVFQGDPRAAAAGADQFRLLDDAELEHAEQLVRAAIRWTNEGASKGSDVLPAFGLIMGELRRLRAHSCGAANPGGWGEPPGTTIHWKPK